MSDYKSPWEKPPQEPRPKPPSYLWRYIKLVVMIVGGVGLVLWFLSWLFPGPVSDIGTAGLIYDIGLLVLIGSSLAAHVFSQPGQALRHLAIWVMIFAFIGLGYGLWTGKGSLSNSLNPAGGQQVDGGIAFQADARGHYVVKAYVNGVPITFLVDTGATDVALSPRDAERLGYDLNRLRYNRPYNTANGMVLGASVSLDQIDVGPIRVQGVAGSVMREGLDKSLLGMSFLNRLTGYQVSGGILTLYE